jgi:hypothetical protein
MWTWLTFRFPEKPALNVTKLIMDAGEVDAGFIHRKGSNIPLVKGNIQTEWNATGGRKKLERVIEDRRGNTHEVRGM